MQAFAFLQSRRRLRKLQRAYYRSQKKDDAIIQEYLSELRNARAAYVGTPVGRRPAALHAGSGGHYVEGWINADTPVVAPIDLAADLSRSIPFKSESLDYIHSEDFLEHLELGCGKAFLAEAWRVLKPGGVMRLLTPDMAALIQRVYLLPETQYIFWCKVQLGAEGACEALNMHFRMNGDHRFIYDKEYLSGLLSDLGFGVRTARWNESKERFLRFLDLRDFGLTIFLEAVKPQR
jgi:predicted SAM-dependent methyltransferase